MGLTSFMNTLPTARRIAIVVYAIVGVALMFKGVEYLIASEVASYHQEVIRIPWDSLDEAEQTLLLGLLKGFGAGSFCVGLGVLVALVPLRRGVASARWGLAVMALAYTGVLMYVTRFALNPGAAPITVTEVLFALSVVAAVVSFIDREPRMIRNVWA